jgi:hypothetical protein
LRTIKRAISGPELAALAVVNCGAESPLKALSAPRRRTDAESMTVSTEADRIPLADMEQIITAALAGLDLESDTPAEHAVTADRKPLHGHPGAFQGQS